MTTIAPCTCTEHQLYHVGCDCGHEEAWYAAPKDTVRVWPKGYAHQDGTQIFKVLAGTETGEIEAKVRRVFGSWASISSITRYDPNPVTVSEAQARYYTLHDNT